MRTLLEIIEAAKDGEKPTHDECYWAMLALDALSTFDQKTIRDLAADPPSAVVKVFGRAHVHEESFKRMKTALNTDPQKWVGPNHDPSNPDVQKRRALAKAVFKKATGLDV